MLRYQQYKKKLNCYYLYLFAWRFATSQISNTSPTEEGGAGRLDWSDNGDGLWQLLSRRAPITKAKFLKGIGESGVSLIILEDVVVFIHNLSADILKILKEMRRKRRRTVHTYSYRRLVGEKELLIGEGGWIRADWEHSTLSLTQHIIAGNYPSQHLLATRPPPPTLPPAMQSAIHQ